MNSEIKIWPLENKREEAPVAFFKNVLVNNNQAPLRTTSLGEVIGSWSDPDNNKFAALTNNLRKLKKEDKELYKEERRKKMEAYKIGSWENRGTPLLYVPCLVLDIDAPDPRSFLDNLEKAKACEYIYFAGQSLGGGTRLFVWCESTPDNHSHYYKEFCKYLSQDWGIPLKGEHNQNEHIDTGTNSLKEMWYPSYTSQKYLNKESSIFKITGGREGYREGKQKGKYKYEFSTAEKVQNIVAQIERKNIDITRGVEMWFKKILLPFANEYGEEGRILAHRVSRFHSDYTESNTNKEYDRAIAKNQGKVTIGTFLSHAFDKGVKIDASQIIEYRTRPQNEVIEEKQKEFFQFFSIKKDGGKTEIKINYLKLVELLKNLGFRRYDKDNEFFIVKIEDNIVRECSKEEVIDSFENYILSFGDEQLPEGITIELLLNKLYSGIGTYFSDKILGRLRPDEPILFNEHEKDKAFFYYKNGFVEITEADVKLKPYSDLKKCIWENQVLKRRFTKVEISQYSDFSFVKFIHNIANCWESHPLGGRKNKQLDLSRLESFKTVIGYLLHSFFERELKAVLFTDSRISDDNEANGRSGKTLLLKSLGYVLNREFKKSKTYVELNGKDFDTSKQFKYQQLGLDTKLLHINDVKRNFKLEDLFNDITEGIKRERKNESPSLIRSKIALSTNLTIQVNGSSAKGRCIEIELSDYYDDSWTPLKEFDEWFFSDWAEKSWQKFDSFMMDCVRMYLKKGISLPGTINLNERKKVEETSIEFSEWMEDKSKAFKTDKSAHQIDGEGNAWWDKKILYTEFKERYSDYSNNKSFSQRKFTKWLKLYGKYDSIYQEVRKEDMKRSNGADYIRFKLLP